VVLQALVPESAKKSRVCWLSWASGAPRLAWHAWYDDALVVVSGDPGQVLGGLEAAETVDVILRSKDTGGRLVRWTGSVAVIDPEDERWDGHAAALLAVRLNLPDPAAAAAGWRTDATIVRITPAVAAQEQAAGPLP
jgi:hypothetical protein